MNSKRPTDYFHQQYGLTLPHTDVVALIEEYQVAPGRLLDLGCGQGRNSLYLAEQGFDVTAYDLNPRMLQTIRDIIEKEGITNITVEARDLNKIEITGEYDLMISTVVMMFLQREAIPNLITQMQQHTAHGGYNLIVSAMSTEVYPFDGFPFTFAEGELRRYYEGWELIHYNEEVGELHRRDADGNRLKLQFATMLARKPA
ncbi:tellurite resistance methyltransferase TehB [Ignatzschineria cameli]|uniref:Tellurite methyltransferase n=1 Tax=Ignatzschineria cameli TaxID=2182793 RepID=A0A2U2ASJ1_9GAMM|nr:tellurite resistance methyltransferase TehB [Ignatzschineria cameli]PWD87188.1 tellurite methyltransferase [Ignatzschineria cameli]